VQQGPDEDPKHQRGSLPLFPDRLATTDTPFAQSINRYSFASNDAFDGGEGQNFLHRPSSDVKAFKDGTSIDPFDPGRLRVGPSVAQERDTGYANPLLTVVDDTIYVLAGTDELDYAAALSTWSTLASITDTTGAVTISDLTSDGVFWYAATGRSVIRGTTTDPAADWSAQDAVSVQYAAGRIMAAVKAGSSSTPNRLTTLTDVGAEELTNGHVTFPEGHSVLLGGVAQGQYFFADSAGTSGSVYSWRLGVDESGNYHIPISVWTLPAGSTPIAIGVAGGMVWVQAKEGGSDDLILYQGVPSDRGQLVVLKNAELAGGGDAPRGTIIEWFERALMTWPDIGTGPGLGAVGLASGGFVNWVDSGVAADDTHDLGVWLGQPVFTDSNGKVFVLADTRATTGWVTTSVADGGSSLDKVWDEVTMLFEPLSTGESIDVEISQDGGDSYISLGSVTGAGTTYFSWALGVSSRSLSVKIILNGASGTAPVVTLVQSRYHPLGLADGVLVLPVVCADQQRGLNGSALPENHKGRASETARELEALAQTRVRVQDIDWPYTGVAETYEVQNIGTTLTWVQNKGKPQLQGVCVLTLLKTEGGYAG
jgi:hypothetical protein